MNRLQKHLLTTAVVVALGAVLTMDSRQALAQVFRSIMRSVAPDGTTLFNRDFGTTREASVSGTVSIGSMTFISDPSWFGEIKNVQTGYHELSR